MRWSPGVALAFPLLMAGLAGCSGQAGQPVASGEFSAAPQLQATATTGVIRGVVVDEAIRPLANATVTARGPDGSNRTAFTNPDGFFGFSDLKPGTWFVNARKLAHTEAQQAVEVVAGVDSPNVVKMQLTTVASQLPFVNSFKIDAFVQCIVPGANVCTILDLYPCALLGYCNNVTQDTSYVLFYYPLVALQRTPDFYQAELVWESTQAVSSWLNLRYSAHEPADGAGLDARQAGARGPSPLIMPINATMGKDWDLGTKKGVAYEVFGCVEEITPYISGCAGFVVNQRVTYYINAFYGYVPPDGWSLAKEGSVPPPPQ